MRRWTKGALVSGALALGLYQGVFVVRAQDARANGEEVLILVNQHRAEAGLPPLRRSAALEQAAQAWAQYMATYRIFSHQGWDGSTPATRAAAAGYRGQKVGENIARGFTSPFAVVSAWIQSPAHRNNILDPEFTETGIGIFSSRSGIYWVQCFGASGTAAPAGAVVLPPTISTIVPYYARMGEEVLITGQRFGTVPGTVTFYSGRTGEIVAWEDDRIAVSVPYGASTGMVYVQTAAGTSAGVYLYVQLPLGNDPLVLQIEPGSALPGSPVRLQGRNLGASPGSVFFNGIPAPISRWSPTGLYVDVLVPVGAVTGPVIVRRADGKDSNTFPFTIPGTVPNPNPAPPAPTESASAFEPPGAPPSPPGSPSPPSLTPALPTPGLVPTPRAPSLLWISAPSGSPGDLLLLSGSWSGSAPTSVTFSGVEASILRWDELSISVLVPPGATSGPVQVRTAAGASNSLPFTVLQPAPPPSVPVPARPQPGTSTPLRGRLPVRGW